jgi:hypothetical protein
MKKIFILCSLILFSSCQTENLKGSLIEDNFNNKSVYLANGEKINIEPYLDKILAGEDIFIDNKKIQAKIMLKNMKTKTTEFTKLPAFERKVKTTNIFDIKEDNLYIDEINSLVWEKDATKSGLMTFTEALNYCETFGEKHYNKPFTVPSPEQLKTILKNNQAHIDTSIFKNLNSTYWTTSKFAYNFYYGDGEVKDKEKGLAYVRCVGVK